MLWSAQPTVCRIRYKCAYITNGQFVSLNLRSIVAAISFSAQEVLFQGPFLLGKVTQIEANNSVCQSHAGSFCFCTIAKGNRWKHLLRVPNCGTRVRAAEMYHDFSAVRWITSVCAERSGLFDRMIVKLKTYSDDGKNTTVPVSSKYDRNWSPKATKEIASKSRSGCSTLPRFRLCFLQNWRNIARNDRRRSVCITQLTANKYHRVLRYLKELCRCTLQEKCCNVPTNLRIHISIGMAMSIGR